MTAKEYKILKRAIEGVRKQVQENYVEGTRVIFSKEEILTDLLDPIEDALESVADWE